MQWNQLFKMLCNIIYWLEFDFMIQSIVESGMLFALRCTSTEHKITVACNSLIRDHCQCDTRDISKSRTAYTSNSQSNQHLCHSHLLYSIKVRGVLGHYILIYSWTEIITATIKFGLPPPSPHSPTQQSQGLSMEYDPPHCPL